MPEPKELPEGYKEFPRLLYHAQKAPRLVSSEDDMNDALGDGFSKEPIDAANPSKLPDGSGSERYDASDWTRFGRDFSGYPVPKGSATDVTSHLHEKGTGNPTVPQVGGPTGFVPKEASTTVADGEAAIQARRESDGVFSEDKTIKENPDTNDADKEMGKYSDDGSIKGAE